MALINSIHWLSSRRLVNSWCITNSDLGVDKDFVNKINGLSSPFNDAFALFFSSVFYRGMVTLFGDKLTDSAQAKGTLTVGDSRTF